jgi:uncharacterized protein involved in copper resistance
MTKTMIVLLALALVVPAIAFAQNNSQSDQDKAQQHEANEAAQAQVTGTDTSPHHTMTGTVGDNGNTLTSNNTVWHVSNPDTLKSYNNQEVTVKYQFNIDKNTIRIDKVESPGK